MMTISTSSINFLLLAVFIYLVVEGKEIVMSIDGLGGLFKSIQTLGKNQADSAKSSETVDKGPMGKAFESLSKQVGDHYEPVPLFPL